MKRRWLSILLSVCMVITLLPPMAVAAGAVEHSHEGWTAVTMGTTYVKFGENEQSSNTLTAGNYYLDGDLTLAGPLYIGDGNSSSGMVTLCLNGHSITTSSTSTDSSGSAIYMKDEAKLTIVDCNATAGTVTGNSYGIYMYDDGTLYISGGTITGNTYGIYNYSPSWNKIYLSGSPSIKGTTAGIYNSSGSSYIYANNGATENPIPYGGSTISLAYSSMYNGNTAVRNVTVETKDKFTLANTNYELSYDSSYKTLKIQGKPQSLTWYAEDGTTPLSGDSYPTSGNSGETISPLPAYTATADGYRFDGWLYRTSGSSWSNYHWSASSRITGSMEFKADVVQVYDITVTDGSNLLFTVNSSAVTQAARNDYVYIASGSEDYYLQGVTVAKASGASVTVSHSDYYGYYFTMPDEAVTVTATLVPVTRSGARVYTAENGDVFLGGDYIELGLRPSGVFGTAAGAPTSGTLIFHPNSKQSNSAIGLRSNGNQTWSAGLATGNDETVDFFLPGTIDEGWIVGWSESDSGSAAVKGLAQASGGKTTTVTHRDSVAVTTGTNAESEKTTLTAVTAATVASTVGVEQTISFDEDGKYFTTSVTLTNNGESTLYDLSYIRAFDPDQRSGASSSPSSASTDNYFYKDSQGNIWVIAFGNNSLSVSSTPTAVSFADMVVNNTAAITPFVFCAKPGEGYTVQAVNTTVGWGSYSDFYRGSSSYQAGANLYGKHYYADKGIGLEFIVNSLGAGQSVTFSWVSSLDSNVLQTIENVRDEIGVVPPAIDNVSLSLSASVDAQGGSKMIDVSAKVKDAAGVDDSLYYSYKPEGGEESDKVCIQTVAADGSEKSLSGTIDLSSFDNSTYTFYFWVSNSEGVTSGKVSKTIIVSDTGLSGDLSTTPIVPSHTHSWSGEWSTDSSSHWHNCTVDGCDITENSQKDSYGAHAYDDDADTTCNTCGYTREVEPSTPTYDISGTVTDSVEGTVTIKLMQGNTPIGDSKTVTLSESDGTYTGAYSFTGVKSGAYNVVATKGDRIVTILVTVASANATEQNLAMLAEDVNSKLEVKRDGEGGVTTPDVVVGGLDDEAKVVKEGSSATSVTVTMTVESKAESAATNSTEIKAAAGGKTLEYLDIKVEKKLDAADAEPMTTTTTVFKIVIPFDKGTKQNIAVYRYHGSSVDIFKEGASNAVDGEYIEVSDTAITIYAKKFSTYAIGYTEEGTEPTPPTPPVGGDNGPTVYTITGADTENGAMTISRKTASKGTTVTITVTPDEGYVLSGLTVTDKSGKEIAVTEKNGKYTFTMPASNVTVSACFVKAGCPKDETCPVSAFSDADAGAWYHDGAHYCLEHDLMKGLGDGRFAPEDDTSRVMIVMMLWRLNGSPVVNYALDFEDVDEGAWYTEAVRWAVSEGIAGGYGNGKFGPEDTVTREQMVTILWRYAQYKGCDVSVGEDTDILSYGDAAEVAEYAIPAMQWACGSGMVEGKQDGNGLRLDPRGSTTRAQTATMMMRFCTQSGK